MSLELTSYAQNVSSLDFLCMYIVDSSSEICFIFIFWKHDMVIWVYMNKYCCHPYVLFRRSWYFRSWLRDARHPDWGLFVFLSCLWKIADNISNWVLSISLHIISNSLFTRCRIIWCYVGWAAHCHSDLSAIN